MSSFSGYHLPALAEPSNPADEVKNVLAIRGMQQQQEAQQQEKQLRDIEIQKAQQQQKDAQAHTAALSQWDVKTDPNGDTVPGLIIKHGGSGDAAMNFKKTIMESKLKYSQMAKDDAETGTKNLELLQKKHGIVVGALNTADDVPDAELPQHLTQTIQQLGQAGVLDPQVLQSASALTQLPPDQIRQHLKLIKKGLTSDGDQLKKAKDEAETFKFNEQGKAAAAGVAKNGPLAPPEIDNLNKTLADRFQVLNPGQPLPTQYTLPANAKAQDYAIIDKALEQVEKARGVKAQQDQAQATREAAASERTEKTGMKPVIGFDGKGNQIFAAQSEAKTLGLKSVREVGQAEAEKVTNARSLMPLLNSEDAEDPGVLQMAKKLEKEGKLGPLAGRWNEFLTGKWGAGDPEYSAFRAKMGLSTTALMQVHVGSRGGAFMLEHFEDLANAKKMDGPTLLSALETESKYVARKAMLPSNGANAPSTSKTGGAQLPAAAAAQLQEGHETTFANGQVWTKKNGQAVQIK